MALGGGNCGAGSFLGFKPWFDGLCDADNNIQAPDKDEDEITRFIWMIILNVMFDLSLAVGYLALGFVIYGGYLYIMSQGDPGKVGKGKKTLMSAITGTIIALLASVAVNTVRVILGIDSSQGWNQGEITAQKVQGIFSWAYTIAGIVAVVFIIKGAIDYMLSHGDPGKTRAATQAIIYAVVGLVVVLLAAAITAFVIARTNSAVTGDTAMLLINAIGVLG